eukprot:TRINITY_DN7639_c0_g1_i1.p1 TRINITY_DN7639_c0_g1~~TRINITY_DN7639_c0_g1_i1.p1  ORF type:complete len:756 (+),score=130.64 TRINITY_DN7639_c0_g1_i1:51-2270(+)
MSAGWKDEIRKKCFDRDSKMGRVYVKKTRLGRGAFGEGWLCTDRVNNRMVVVKISNGPITSEKDEFNCKKEVSIMQEMDHPNVVKFYEAWMEKSAGEERLHIAMEYCDSGDLGSLIKKRHGEKRNQKIIKKMAEDARKKCLAILKGYSADDLLRDRVLFNQLHERATSAAEQVYSDTIDEEGRLNSWSLPELESWMVQLLWGIWYIHKKKVIHRDIKPDNVFLSGGGKIIKIGDFGISGLQSCTNAGLVTRAGTPLYMAPEMWDGCTYSDRVDVFAVGVMFYELSGLVRAYDARLPFADKWGHPWSVQNCKFLKRQISNREIRPMNLPQKQIEASFFEIIKTMIRKDPKVRPTAGQVLRGIRLQRVSREVMKIFKKDDNRGGNPFNNSDRNFVNVYNPADNQSTFHDTARFQCSSKTSEVLMIVSKNRESIRPLPGFSKDPIGYLSHGDILEVMERKTIDGKQWVRSQAGWFIAQSDGKSIVTPCPEDLLTRSKSGIEALGAYADVIHDVHNILSNALKVKPKTTLKTTPLSESKPTSQAKRSGTGSAVKNLERKNSFKGSGPPKRVASRSPVVDRLYNNPPKEGRPSSPVRVRNPSPPRRSSPSPPRRVSLSPVRIPPGGRLVVDGPKTPVTPLTPGRRSRTPPRKPSPKKHLSAAQIKEQSKILKQKVVNLIGKADAKNLFKEYFEKYSSCYKKCLPKGAPNCHHLQSIENTMKLRLGSRASAVDYVKECARINYCK